jgi:hypothetical protein
VPRDILPSNPHVLYAVRLIVERQEIDNRWQSHRWVIHDLIPLDVDEGFGLPPSNTIHFSRLRKDDGGAAHGALFTAEASIDLHRAEAEAYAENLLCSEPAIYVVLRQNDSDDENDDPEIDVHLAEISVSPYNIQDILDCGEDQVEKLALQGPVAEFLKDFVEIHFKPEPFKKRKRDKAKIERDNHPGGPRAQYEGVFSVPSHKMKREDYN